MSEENATVGTKRIEAEARRKYSGAFYDPATLVRSPGEAPEGYFDRLLALKIELVRRFGSGRRTLDLCCATGEHLVEVLDLVSEGFGLDFSMPLLERAVTRRSDDGNAQGLFLCGNARQLPLASGRFGLVYSFSSLYIVTRVEDCVAEIGRVLEPGGVAILEFGNLRSLNTLVCRAHSETSAPCHIGFERMGAMLRDCGFEILEHRAFQILPMWGEKPRWLRPLLGPWARGLMERVVGGKMVDEWICGLPLVKRLAFRHVFVCRRAEGNG